MERLGGTRRPEARRLPLLLLAATLAALPAAAMAAPALPHQAWAQEHDETRHGWLAVEEAVYTLERHGPVTVRITGQMFAESDERRQVDVVVTLPDSSRSEQAALATRGGHFAVPYQLDKPFPAGADSRPGRYAVSASHGGLSLGTVHFEVVRPPQVPAAVASTGGDAGEHPGGGGGQGAVSGLSASASRPIYSPDAAVTVHGTAEGAGAGVRLRIDIAGPSAGVVYSGALTTSGAGTYSATIMAPDGRWGADGEYTAVVTGAGHLARAPFWVESGGQGAGGGGGGAALHPQPEEDEEAAPAADRRQDEEAAGGGPTVPAGPAPGSGHGPAAGAPDAQGVGEGAAAGAAQEPPLPPPRDIPDGQAAAGGQDTAVVLAAAAVAVAAAAAAAVAAVLRKASAPKEANRAAGDKRPVARRPAAPGAAAAPSAQGAAGAPADAAASRRRAPAGAARAAEPSPRRGARHGGGGGIMRIVLDMSVVVNHKRRSMGELSNPDFYGPQLDYVDSRRGDLLLPERDRMRQGTREYASANLRPFEMVYEYELYEKALGDLRRQLVDSPLSGESARWIDRKYRWANPEDSVDAEGARIGAILDKMGMPRRDGTGGERRTSLEAIVRHGREGGEGDLKDLLRHLDSAAGQDLQILAIAMKESEERASILLANDYDLFAFPIWRGRIDKSECGPVTMVLGPADVRWIVSMPDGSARVLDKRENVRELYSEEEYMEVMRALQYSIAKG